MGKEDRRVYASNLPLDHTYLRLRVFRLLVFWVIALLVTLVFTGKPQRQPLNYYLTVAWTLFFPIALAGLLGALCSQKVRPSEFSGIVEKKVIFTIPTVAREDTLPALRRVISSIIRYAPSNLADFCIDVIVDEGSEGEHILKQLYEGRDDIRIVVVPDAYETPNKTTHKGRANHAAMKWRNWNGENTNDVFVYHLDDDTSVGPDTIASIAEFIAKNDGTKHLAQGVLVFPFELSSSWFCRLADSVRPPDDLTRFYLFTGVLGSPLVGLHGEHLLVRSSVESEIGWDFGSTKVEDAAFALKFAERYPRTSTFLPSCVYGASPSSVRDLVKQRRRWACGLLSLVFDRSIRLRTKAGLAYSVLNWSLGIFQHVGVVLVLAYATGVRNTSPISWVLLPIWSFNFAYQLWMYWEGLRINMHVSGKTKYVLYALVLTPLVFVFTAVEAFASLLGLVDFVRKDESFDVISKEI